jgi:hypothetical protein
VGNDISLKEQELFQILSFLKVLREKTRERKELSAKGKRCRNIFKLLKKYFVT